jgi:hypothetical protein
VLQQLVEEGFEAVLSRKQRATPAIPRIFDGEKEAKLMALACFQAAQGPHTLDLALAGEQGRGTRHRRSCQRQHDRPGSKKRARIGRPPVAVETDRAIVARRGAAESFLVDLSP